MGKNFQNKSRQRYLLAHINRTFLFRVFLNGLPLSQLPNWGEMLPWGIRKGVFQPLMTSIVVLGGSPCITPPQLAKSGRVGDPGQHIAGDNELVLSAHLFQDVQ